MNEGITFAELLAYSNEENERWKDFFSRHPEALELPLDIAGSVKELVVHIFLVELFFARAINGMAQVPSRDVVPVSIEELFSLGEQAAELFHKFMANASPEGWKEQVEVTSVRLKASRRKMLAQALTHSMRHWAQIATFLRQQGHKQEWQHDFLLSRVME